MKLQLLTLTLLVALLLAGPAAAQDTQPPLGDRPPGPVLGPAPDRAWDELQPFSQHPLVDGSTTAFASPAVPIGQPGLSFRHVQTFGETQVPYFTDTSHLNYP